MTAADYETLVHSLVTTLIQRTSLAALDVHGGARNRITGASGYRHQIDVSVRESSSIYLVEVKHWARSVNVQAILVLASRIADIRSATPNSVVHASIVSTKLGTRGANKLATHLGINIDVVKSLNEYAIRLSDWIFIGTQERLEIGSWMKAEVIHPPAKRE